MRNAAVVASVVLSFIPVPAAGYWVKLQGRRSGNKRWFDEYLSNHITIWGIRAYSDAEQAKRELWLGVTISAIARTELEARDWKIYDKAAAGLVGLN